MKLTVLQLVLLASAITGTHGKDIAILGWKCVVPDSWTASEPSQGIDSVGGQIQTATKGFSIGWSFGPGTGDIVEQRSKDGNEVVIREELKKGSVKGVMLIVKTGQKFGAYAAVAGLNFYAYCDNREQVDLFAKFIRSNFHHTEGPTEPKEGVGAGTSDKNGSKPAEQVVAPNGP